MQEAKNWKLKEIEHRTYMDNEPFIVAEFEHKSTVNEPDAQKKVQAWLYYRYSVGTSNWRVDFAIAGKRFELQTATHIDSDESSDTEKQHEQHLKAVVWPEALKAVATWKAKQLETLKEHIQQLENLK